MTMGCAPTANDIQMEQEKTKQAQAMSVYRDEAADLRGQLKAYRAMAVIPSEPAKADQAKGDR